MSEKTQDKPQPEKQPQGQEEPKQPVAPPRSPDEAADIPPPPGLVTGDANGDVQHEAEDAD